MLKKTLFLLLIIGGCLLVEKQMIAQNDAKEDKELKDLFDEIDIEALFKSDDEDITGEEETDEAILGEEETELSKMEKETKQLEVPSVPSVKEEAKKVTTTEIPVTEAKVETKIVTPAEPVKVEEKVKEPEIIKAEEIMEKAELQTPDETAKK